jgi:hypothetical protein
MAYTTIDDPSQYFQIATYTGTSDDSNKTVTNDGNSDLQPDWMWIKARSGNYSGRDHAAYDSSRGVSKRIEPSATDAEASETSGMAFNSDGFTAIANYSINGPSTEYVAWQWKANGGTTSSNSDGDITSTVQANTTAGFSIITYTGNGTAGQTLGHGLGVAPSWITVKERGNTRDWNVFHHKNTSAPATDFLVLNSTDATADAANRWNDTMPSSSVITIGDTARVNDPSGSYLMYVFTEIQGYSKFGSYTGNGNADGPFIYTGFKPAWVLGKNTTSAGNHWFINDNKRGGNGGANWIKADSDAAELTNLTNPDFVSNGFKIRNSNAIFNENNSTFIYMAFAEHPFVSSKGVPVTAE